MNIAYIINSHVSYSTPLKTLLASMHGVKNVFVYVAGAELTSHAVIDNHTFYYVQHNSFDYTGLIEFVQHPIPFITHVFCLQDTMVFGANSSWLIKQVDPMADATAAFGGQCNLVLYDVRYLLSKKDEIISRRNLSKAESIQREGELWRTAVNRQYYHNSSYKTFSIHRPYGTDVPRMLEYYTAVDIHKYKSCWGQNMKNLNVSP